MEGNLVQDKVFPVNLISQISLGGQVLRFLNIRAPMDVEVNILRWWSSCIGPFLRDICASSSLWWDEVLNAAGALYRVWLNSEPMERLRLVPITPPAFQRPPRLRIEQRGSVALLKAIPESLRSELVSQREVGSVSSIVFKVLRVYQPGGLGKRTTLAEAVGGSEGAG